MVTIGPWLKNLLWVPFFGTEQNPWPSAYCCKQPLPSPHPLLDLSSSAHIGFIPVIPKYEWSLQYVMEIQSVSILITLFLFVETLLALPTSFLLPEESLLILSYSWRPKGMPPSLLNSLSELFPLSCSSSTFLCLGLVLQAVGWLILPL